MELTNQTVDVSLRPKVFWSRCNHKKSCWAFFNKTKTTRPSTVRLWFRSVDSQEHRLRPNIDYPWSRCTNDWCIFSSTIWERIMSLTLHSPKTSRLSSRLVSLWIDSSSTWKMEATSWKRQCSSRMLKRPMTKANHEPVVEEIERPPLRASKATGNSICPCWLLHVLAGCVMLKRHTARCCLLSRLRNHLSKWWVRLSRIILQRNPAYCKYIVFFIHP